jgi:hypothetical protein
MNLLVVVLFLAAVIIAMLVMVIINQNHAAKQKNAQPTLSDAGVRDLLAQGRDDEALQIYQRFTGVDLFTAKEALAHIKQAVQLGEMEQDLQRRLRLGDKAGAIELYQQTTGATLAEALAIIEAMEQKKA